MGIASSFINVNVNFRNRTENCDVILGTKISIFVCCLQMLTRYLHFSLRPFRTIIDFSILHEECSTLPQNNLGGWKLP